MSNALQFKPLVFGCLTIFFILFVSCSEDDIAPGPKPKLPYGQSYSSDHDANLNIIYFIPSDLDTLPDYNRRISGIMLHTQNYYRQEMKRNGFGDKTFGLLKDDNYPDRIKITVIRGEKASAAYPYQGGATVVRREVEKYFRNNPKESSSDHYVIFQPSNLGDNGWDAGGTPIYGYDKFCHVMDYKYFDMATWGDNSREAQTSYIGTTMHEIGHALNLPHNASKATEDWIALMGVGNLHYNQSPNMIHLTKADATILNTCQVMNKDAASNYYNQEATHTLHQLQIKADASHFYFNCTFDSNIPITGINVYQDPQPNATDDSYNAISWAVSTEGKNEVALQMPLNEVDEKFKTDPFILQLRFCHKNGNATYEKFMFTYKDGKPDFVMNLREVDELDKSNWTVSEVSSEEIPANGQKEHLIDNDVTSFWHTEYSNTQPGYPHYFVINLGQIQTIHGFSFMPFQNKINGRMKDISLEVSQDGQQFTKLGDYRLNDGRVKQLIDLDQSVQGQYIKVVAKSGHSEDEINWHFTHLAEFGVF